MGCDIHVVLQWKPEGSSDHWWSLSFDEIDWNRDYELFAAMAGVRCYAENCNGRDECAHAVAKPRGLPGGFRAPYNMSFDYLHTPSWLTLDEAKKAISAVAVGPEVKATIAAMESFHASGCEARLVFAFDS